MKRTKHISILLVAILIVGVLAGCLAGCSPVTLTSENMDGIFKMLDEAITESVNQGSLDYTANPNGFYVKVIYAKTGGITRNSYLQAVPDNPDTIINEAKAKLFTEKQLGTFALDRLTTTSQFGMALPSDIKPSKAKPEDYKGPFVFTSRSDEKINIAEPGKKENMVEKINRKDGDFEAFLATEVEVPYNVITNKEDDMMAINEMYPATIVEKLRGLSADSIIPDEKSPDGGLFNPSTPYNTHLKQGISDTITLMIHDENSFYDGKHVTIILVNGRIDTIKYAVTTGDGDTEETVTVTVNIIYGAPKTEMPRYDAKAVVPVA